MTEAEKRKAAKAFAEYWKDKGYEKGESQSFWLALLRDVLGVEHPEQYIKFEDQVKLDHTSFIDGYIQATHVLIEQKGIDKDLRKPIKQSDGSLLTPFQQAKRYSSELPYSQRPRWIITCNFKEFLIYDMEKPTGEPESILLSELPKECYRLQFLVEEKSELLHREEQVSIKAGELVGKLYDAILKQYINPDDEHSLRSLNMLCVRLVFCLYAEDAGIFGGHNKFHNYIKKVADNDIDDVREAIIKLFKILDTPYDKRSQYLKADLSTFPYVNGGLFADEDIEIPNFTQEIVDLLLHNASEDFDWSQISPTIFGAVFESTLNPETRRSGGMHYTSIENIHKVIDPLFLDELHEELDEIKALKIEKTRENRLNAFREKLGNLVFFDPACGSGNFLTQTYIELRRLENEALEIMQKGGQIGFDFGDIIKVSIGQFYGIEINDFAVTVAKTALWIAESQMMKETEDILQIDLDFLPLKSYANIVEGNALRIDWETVVPKDKLNYIMGNPPFVGTNWLSDEQRNDMDLIWEGDKRGKADYVTCWYIKAAHYMSDTAQCAFVSTNSICQGEQAVSLWKKVLLDNNLEIIFAVQSFVWNSESTEKASVHVVIVGLAHESSAKKVLFSEKGAKFVDNINEYLLPAPTVLIEERSKPLCKVPAIVRGSQATDNGLYLFTPEEKEEFIQKEPQTSVYFKRFMMGREFINNIERWCIWIPNISPSELRKCPQLMDRVKKVRDFRLSSKNAQTKVAADYPHRFGQYRAPSKQYIAFAKVSSERRRYIPMGFLTDNVIPGDKLFTIPNADLYMFGILMSNVHNSWMRTTCGRLKSDYSYSTTIVYNNFPWPNPTEEQKAKIEQTAQAILDARALYPDCSLADLYDEVAMPPELRKAHQANDRAVMQAYGFWGKLNSESECVAELMKMYQELTK